jgi:hypothetical protein
MLSEAVMSAYRVLKLLLPENLLIGSVEGTQGVVHTVKSSFLGRRMLVWNETKKKKNDVQLVG